MKSRVRKWTVVMLALAAAGAGAGLAAPPVQSPSPTTDSPRTGPRHLGADRELQELTLVRSASGRAVVRFGAGPLTVVRVGDRLGRPKAEVKEIDPGRLVLEEQFTGPDGRPNRALTMLRDGERGGTRYTARPEEQPSPASRPRVIGPSPKQDRQ